MMDLLMILVPVVAFVAGIILLIIGHRKQLKGQSLLTQSVHKLDAAQKEIEVEKREAANKLKEELYNRRSEFELEMKRERAELERFQIKLNGKYDAIEKKELRIEETIHELQQKERALSRATDAQRAHEQKLKTVYDELTVKLEAISGMTREQARESLLEALEAEVVLANEKYIQKLEDDTRLIAKEKATNIVVTAMQRYTADLVAPHSSGVVHLPRDEMKGRIIGKEGRNIKALEVATGMEFIIGETPEIITIAGFNPIRREVARRALEKLIADGRINPSRIEETVAQCEEEIDEMIQEYGKNAVLEFNLQGIKQEMVTLLGKLYFRTSFSQNVLAHSIEVGILARMIAEELGLPNPEIALRGGLLHDIGKAVSAEIEGPHALIGADIAKRCGEDPRVVNCIAAHHEEAPFESVYAPIVMIADTISASRPGARRETLSAYIKRLEKLEEISNRFDGVKKAYALQAGREIRIIVMEDYLDDVKAAQLARDIARQIEKDMAFPGQIKVNVIREKRSIEYAR